MPEFPPLALLRQELDSERVEDAASAVRAALAPLDLGARVRPGQSVAVGAGSRGIDRLDQVLGALCHVLCELGARPFVFPAMGSHGGATAEGQRNVLAALGVHEQALGCPVVSSQETVRLGDCALGLPVHVDAAAARADHIVVINRIKPHTKFTGPLESGLFKMLAVGMGKQPGAAQAHAQAVRHGFSRVIASQARAVLACCPVLLGLGLVENGLGELRTVRALLPETMEAEERELLALARNLAPKLPFADLDLLIVDEIGKDVSGTGMDTNVTGRNRDILGDFTGSPRIKRILVLGLTELTAGNALGIGFADFTTDRLVAAMDYRKTVTNALTGMSPEKAAIPIHLPSDRKALAAALDSLGPWDPRTVRMARIRNTQRLERLQASPALLDEASGCTVLRKPEPIAFDPGGDLPDFPET
jgi:hypothetical protein